MLTIQLIAKKRSGLELTTEEIQFLVDGTVSESIPDYQLAAFLMAVCCRGMTLRETTDLTLAMARSGAMLDLSEFSPPAVDKHSTGGVGDKTTLVVAPMVAACGVPVAKMSGHALGFSGGTIDKLESIPGYRTSLSTSEFISNLRRVGLVIAGQSKDLAPADGRLYALRDQTATVDCIPLIVSSVLSKKLAAGAKTIVLDVKFGSGSFLKSQEQAMELARTLVRVGHSLGRKVIAVLSSMEQPLGLAIGNRLEIREAVATLKGSGPEDLRELSLRLGAEMIKGAGVVKGDGEAQERLLSVIEDGRALQKLVEVIEAQGGDARSILDIASLPSAPVIRPVQASSGGYVASIDAEVLGWAVVKLGGGRISKGARIDPTVGLELRAKLGDLLVEGQPLAIIHAADESSWSEAAQAIQAAYAFSSTPVISQPLIADVIGSPD